MFKRKKSKLQLAQEEAQEAINETNKKIDELGGTTQNLYLALIDIQALFDKIRNIPNENKLRFEKLKRIRLNWKHQAEKIERDYNNASLKSGSAGVAGAGIGVAVVTMGPTVAMGVATTFGVASTGTAISALSGAAATNAALAWLGGGALAVGGGGIAAGEAFLALAGPIGWAIAGVALLASGIFIWKNRSEKKRLEEIFTLISKRDVKSYSLAIVELNERIKHIISETGKLQRAIIDIRTFGTDYNDMSELQKYALGSYVNLMNASTQLLVNPIFGLQPKYTEKDFNIFINQHNYEEKADRYIKHKSLIVTLANLLFKIDLDDKDKKLICKSFKNNKKMLESFDISKKDFDIEIIFIVFDALNYKYSSSKEY